MFSQVVAASSSKNGTSWTCCVESSGASEHAYLTEDTKVRNDSYLDTDTG